MTRRRGSRARARHTRAHRPCRRRPTSRRPTRRSCRGRRRARRRSSAASCRWRARWPAARAGCTPHAPCPHRRRPAGSTRPRPWGMSPPGTRGRRASGGPPPSSWCRRCLGISACSCARDRRVDACEWRRAGCVAASRRGVTRGIGAGATRSRRGRGEGMERVRARRTPCRSWRCVVVEAAVAAAAFGAPRAAGGVAERALAEQRLRRRWLEGKRWRGGLARGRGLAPWRELWWERRTTGLPLLRARSRHLYSVRCLDPEFKMIFR